MKKQILIILTILGLLFSTNLLAVTPEEYKKIANSFKLKNTSEKELPPKSFKINGQIIKVEIHKENEDFGDEEQYVQHMITIGKYFSGTQGVLAGLYRYDQKSMGIACVSKNETVYLASIVKSSVKRIKKVHYHSLISFVYKDELGEDRAEPFYDGEDGEYVLRGGFTSIPIYKPKQFYPYYNEEKILARLYETCTCDKEATEKANIAVLVNGKWIPQEQSWNIKSVGEK